MIPSMKLADYLKANKIKRHQFAALIGVSPQMITVYCDGTVWPPRDKMEAILRETAGAVTPNDFIDELAGAPG